MAFYHAVKVSDLTSVKVVLQPQTRDELYFPIALGNELRTNRIGEIMSYYNVAGRTVIPFSRIRIVGA